MTKREFFQRWEIDDNSQYYYIREQVYISRGEMISYIRWYKGSILTNYTRSRTLIVTLN